MTSFQWIAFFSILAIAFAGAYFPFFRPELAKKEGGFSLGQAFSAGFFLAMSLVIMLPNGTHLLEKAWPSVTFPISSLLMLAAFIALLALAHAGNAARPRADAGSLSGPTLPIIMVVMIAIPSFLLGAALGVSGTFGAVLVFAAVMLHKGSAGFALALSLVRSTLTYRQAVLVYCLFAFATPVGVLLGAALHEHLQGHTVVVIKGLILSLAAGVFLFMGTLHELKHTPLVVECCTVRGFLALVAGMLLTVWVRLIVGLAHTGHHAG